VKKVDILREIMALLLRATMIPLIIREVFQKRKVTIILYHRIRAPLFREHLAYLSKHYSIVSLDEFILAKNTADMKSLPHKSLVITFDDGAKETYMLRDAMREYTVPITMFLCSELVGTKRHFWWNHDEKISVDLKKVEDSQRLKLLWEVGYDDKREYGTPQVLSNIEVVDLIHLGVGIQSHGLTHAILPRCDDTKAEVEITKSKADLKGKFGININYFSYPNGDYCLRDIDICKKAGYIAGITTDLGFNDIYTDIFRLKRICIYDNASVNQLPVRATGVWGFAQRIFEKSRHLRGEVSERISLE